MAEFDVKQLKGNDRFIVGGGVLVFLASFFPWYGGSFSGAGSSFSSSVRGWSAGGLAVLGILLCVAAAAFVVLTIMGTLKDVTLPTGPALLVAGASGLGAVFFLLRWITLPSGGVSGLAGSYHYGPRIGLFLALGGAVVQAAFAVLSFRTSGETIPGLGQPGGTAVPPPPPPPPSYPPPPVTPPAPPATPDSPPP
jgi:hypothetical protein